MLFPPRNYVCPSDLTRPLKHTQLAISTLAILTLDHYFAGHLSGYEAAIHAMHQVFEDAEAEGVILVDATNAFNCLNCQTALLTVQPLCPALSISRL